MAKNQHTQRIFIFFKSVNEFKFIKKCKNRTFKVWFQCQKSTEYFFLTKNNFLASIIHLFSTIMSEFFLTFFLWVSWFLIKKSWILGPTNFETLQPDWYYCVQVSGKAKISKVETKKKLLKNSLPLGLWKLTVDTWQDGPTRYSHQRTFRTEEPFYILFNPFVESEYKT